MLHIAAFACEDRCRGPGSREQFLSGACGGRMLEIDCGYLYVHLHGLVIA